MKNAKRTLASVWTVLLAANAGDHTAAAAGSVTPSDEKPYVCQSSPSTSVGYDQPGLCPSDGLDLIARKTRLRIAVLIFPDVEDIDFAGPTEAFGASGNIVFTVAATNAILRTANGVAIKPDYDLLHAPVADVLLIPGGGVEGPIADPSLIASLRKLSAQTRITMSVCNGAFILGKAGLLDGHAATTTAHHLSRLATEFPRTKVVRDQRYVDEGNLITTGGLTAGIDGALHLIEREQGKLRAADAARYMEYSWQSDAKNAFGDLARHSLPAINALVPNDVGWERLVDNGDSMKWRVAGAMSLHRPAIAFLDSASSVLLESGWISQQEAVEKRVYCKVDGTRHWNLELGMAPRAGNEYEFSMTIADKPDAFLCNKR